MPFDALRLSRVKTVSHNLHSGKVKMKHESVEILLDYLNEQDVLDSLNEHVEEWVNLFVAVKEALYREMKKTEDKVAAGRNPGRDELHANNCRDLLANVVASANVKGAIIPYREYFAYVNRCIENAFLRKHCMVKCLNTFNKNILGNEDYWAQFTIEDVIKLLKLFKQLHNADINSKALQCYLSLIKTAVNYMLTPELLIQEREFIKEVIMKIQSSNICWLLETSAELFLIFSQVCGPIFKNFCIEDGEALIVHLFCFYQPYGSFSAFKETLFQLSKQHLELHSGQQEVTSNWKIVLRKIGEFIKSLIERDDGLFMLPSNNGQCPPDFTVVVAEYYLQSMNVQLINSEETPSKRAKVEPLLVEILQNIETNLQNKWLLVFTEVLKIRPQVLNADYYNRLVPFLTNYVQDSKSTVLRGCALNCLCVLLTIEDTFNSSNQFNKNWKSLYKSTIRTLGLNQNVTESNLIMRELMQRKHELIRNESYLLLNLYITKTVSVSPDALLTLKVFGSIFNIFSNDSKIHLLNYIIPEKLDIPTNTFVYFGYDATAEIVANITYKNWINKDADVRMAIMINNDVCLHLIRLLWNLTKEVETCTKLDKLLSFTYFLLGMVFEYRQTGDKQFITEIETIANCVIRVGLMPQLSNFFDTFNTSNDKFTNGILMSLRSLLYLDIKVNDIVRSYIDDTLVEQMTTAFGCIECKNPNRNDPMLKLKLSMIRTLNTYALRSRTDYEDVLKSVLFDFGEFSISDKTEYIIIMTMVEGLAEDDMVMNQDAFDNVLSLIQTIIKNKSDNYNVVLDLINIFKNIFRLAINNSVLPYLLSSLKSLHFKRYNFGVKVHLALAECFEVLSRLDDNCTRAVLNTEHIVLLVVDYLESNYSEVHDVVFKTMKNLFGRNVKCPSLTQLKRQMLKAIKKKLNSIHVGVKVLTKDIFEKTAMDLITNIIISSKKDEFTKNALCELFISWKKFEIEEIFLHNAIETIGSKLNHFSLNEHLKLLFNSWMKHHCILDFPYKLLNCNTKKEFFKNHMEIFTSLSYKNYQYQYDIICNELELTPMEIEEQCFSNLIAKRIANEIQGVAIECSGESISQPNKEDILANIDDILINILQYVNDADDFQNIFESVTAPPSMSEAFLSHNNFQNDIVKHLYKYLDCNLWEVIFKSPLKLHKILLELKKNMMEKSSIDDKILEFYRYVICVDEMIKYTKLRQGLCKFVIRNIIYFLINLINREDALIVKHALKYLCKFMDFCVASENAEAFADFVIITCSCLMPLAIANDQDALNSLSKIILSNNETIEEKLQYLDPLQSDCEHIQPLRDHHLRLRGENNTLENEIKLFLSEEQFKNSRTEGLIHLRQCLNDNTDGLKKIYLQLNDMRGKLSRDSIIHSLICKLLELLKSTDKREADEALLCLGLIGAKDLTTMVLQSEAKTFKKKDTLSILFVRKVAECLADYLVDYDMDIAKYANDALIALSTVEEYLSICTLSDVRLKSILLPFLQTKQSKNSRKCIPSEFDPSVADSSLWCPDIEISHSDWIIQLVMKLFDLFVDNDFINILKLIVAKKIQFAEVCFPFALSLVLDLPESDLILSVLESFFTVHILSFKNNNTHSITMNKISIKCVLNALHYIELLKPEGKIRKNINLNLNYLDMARAAQYCSRFFTALMYVEKWYHNNSLEIIKGSENWITFRAILCDAYTAIGDKDALYGGHLVNDANKCQIVSSNQNHDFLLLHRELNVQHSLPDFANSLRDHALYSASLLISKRHEIFNDTLYECAWRLGQWNEPTRDELSGFESHVYSVLNAFNDNDELSFNRWLQHAREDIANDLKNISLESCTVLYGPLSKLERLQEVEDIFKVLNPSSNIPALINKFASKDEIFTDFNYYEPRVAQRITAFGILHEKHIADAENYYNSMRLNLADLARKEGRKHIAQAIINDLQSIRDENIQAKATLIDVQLSWTSIHSIDYLKNVLNVYRNPNKLRAELLKTCGEWIAEKNLESPKRILKDYFFESLEIQNNQQIPDAKAIAELSKVIGKFTDDYYQTLAQQIKSPEFEQKLKHLEKMKEKVQRLKSIENPTDEMRRSRIIHERLTLVDEREIFSKRDDLKKFLKFSFQHYLHYLRYSENIKIQLFRIFALLLENKMNVELISNLKAKFLEIDTYKLLIILPQLIPHITTDEDVFSSIIFRLIESCAIKHPHHTIPLILAVLNTEMDNKYIKDNATSSNEARIKGTEKLIHQLETNPKLRKIIRENMNLSEAVIELAYHQSKEDCKRSSILKIPRHMKIVSISNLNNCLLPTYTLPVRPSGNYDDIVGIHKFSASFGAVGGINAPKRVECVGTDGIKRPQLVKGKDDLRQDAVMQQVFAIMNDLLRENKETRNLLIRTYKVVPLSKCSGLLEWVENSMPINEYLIDAHKRYYPADMDPDTAKGRLDSSANAHDSRDKRLHIFQDICSSIRPVFHKFFETNFLEPTVWYERRRAYTESVATSSMCGYILGIGDRHLSNILIDKSTAEVIHIDFGIAFEQGLILPTPETVPFRLSRDIVDGIGVCGVEGTFRRTCEKTMDALRRNSITILTILEVLLYDPLYAWSITPMQAYNKQSDKFDNKTLFSDNDREEINTPAARALSRLKQKLDGLETGKYITVETQVQILIQKAMQPSNLAKLYHGWAAYL